jgi:hypothetical protein
MADRCGAQNVVHRVSFSSRTAHGPVLESDRLHDGAVGSVSRTGRRFGDGARARKHGSDNALRDLSAFAHQVDVHRRCRDRLRTYSGPDRQIL